MKEPIAAFLSTFLFLINIVFWISGLLILLSAGVIYTLANSNQTYYMTQDGNSFNAGNGIVFGIGAAFFIVGFLGFCGVCRKSKSLMIWTVCCLLLILVSQVATGIWAVANTNSFETMIHEAVRDTVLNEYGKPESQTRTEAFDVIQKNMECCGYNSPHDWGASSWKGSGAYLTLSTNSKVKSYGIPVSCCRANATESQCKNSVNILDTSFSNSAIIFTDGCSEKLVEKFQHSKFLIFGIFTAIAFIEVLALTITLCLYCMMRVSIKYKQ